MKARIAVAAALVFMLGCVLDGAFLTGSGMTTDEAYVMGITAGRWVQAPRSGVPAGLEGYRDAESPRPPAELAALLAPAQSPPSWRALERLLVATEFHPPLYYAASIAWLHVFGQGLDSLRRHSLFWMVLGGLFCSALAFRLGGGPAAALCLALWPWQPWIAYHGTEARSYEMGTALASAFLWSMLLLRQEGFRWGAVLVLCASASAAALTHYYLAPPVALCLFLCLIYPGKLPAVAWLLLISLAGIIAFPWMLQMPTQLGDPLKPGQAWIAGELGLVGALSGPAGLFFKNMGASFLPSPFLASALLCLAFGLLFWSSRRLWRDGMIPFVFGLTCLCFPAAMDLMRHTLSTGFPRYGFFCMAAFMPLGAAAYTSRPFRFPIMAGGLLILAIWAWGWNTLLHSENRYHAEFSKVACLVREGSGPKALVLARGHAVELAAVAGADPGPAPWIWSCPNLGDGLPIGLDKALAASNQAFCLERIGENFIFSRELARRGWQLRSQQPFGMMEVSEFRHGIR